MPGQALHVVLEMENRGENAYYVTLHIPHIPGLSFRKSQVLEVSILTGGKGRLSLPQLPHLFPTNCGFLIWGGVCE